MIRRVAPPAEEGRGQGGARELPPGAVLRLPQRAAGRPRLHRSYEWPQNLNMERPLQAVETRKVAAEATLCLAALASRETGFGAASVDLQR